MCNEIGYPRFLEKLLEKKFPVDMLMLELNFYQLYPGESKRTYFIARISTGSLFLATNSQIYGSSKFP
jgi:hypothetical protein